MADLLYSGGPCNGRHVTVPDAELTDGTIACGGLVYHAYNVLEGEWLALPPGHAPPHIIHAVATQAGPAWRSMMHRLAVGVPADAARCRASRQVLIRIAKR